MQIMEKVISGFKNFGIFLLNADLFSEADVLPTAHLVTVVFHKEVQNQINVPNKFHVNGDIAGLPNTDHIS